jgi:SAM-dependent methyltransferase
MTADFAEELRPIDQWLGEADLEAIYSSSAWNDPGDEQSKEWWIADGSETAYSRLRCYLDGSGLTDDYEIAEQYIGRIPTTEMEVADLAAGIGWTSSLLSRLANVRSVHAVEISRHRLELLFPRAVHMFKGEASKIRRHLGSFYQLGLAESSIDVVFLSAAFHHASNPLRLLNEIDRVLKPGGHLVMIGENVISAVAILRRAIKRLLVDGRLCTNFYELFPPDDIWGDHYYRASDYFLFLQMLGYQVVTFSVQKKQTAVIIARRSST